MNNKTMNTQVFIATTKSPFSIQCSKYSEGDGDVGGRWEGGEEAEADGQISGRFCGNHKSSPRLYVCQVHIVYGVYKLLIGRLSMYRSIQLMSSSGLVRKRLSLTLSLCSAVVFSDSSFFSESHPLKYIIRPLV